MSASNTRTSSTPATSSTLRPRQRRLISGLDEGDEVTFDPTTAPDIRIASPVPTAHSHRPNSPIPPKHLSRPSSESTDGKSRSNHLSALQQGTGVRGLSSDSSTSLEKLWGTSWSAIQGIASDLLGSSAQDGPPLAKGKMPRARKTVGRSSNHRPSASLPLPTAWGPKTPGETPTINGVGAGTKEEAEAAVRARKRLDMLLNQDSQFTDSLGRYKRRTSEDTMSVSQDIGKQALAYLHRVRKNDTLAGITLRYNCSAAALRRANRMWPNDTIQGRDEVLLPVDACGVKGRPTSGPEEVDLLGDENAPIPAGLAEQPSVTPAPPINGDVGRNRSDSIPTSTTGEQSISTRSVVDSEPAWHHDSWVLLPGTTKPTEIVRLSRQALGYFPPARRKSLTFSDLDSPKSSIDRPRSVIVEAMNQRAARSPARKSSARRPSNARRSSSAYMQPYFNGPGGVGTMDRDVRAPGPAQDSLNLFFAKHLPDVAPPRNQHSLYQPDLPLFSDDITPLASGHSTPNANKNLEHVGGAIEAWMRRVASKAKDAMEPQDRLRAARASVGAPGKGAGGVGDLIEMTDEFEIGNDEDEESHLDLLSNTHATNHLSEHAANSSTTSYFASTSRHRTSANKSGKSD